MFPLTLSSIIALLVLAAGAVAAVRAGKLTGAAGIAAFVVGIAVYMGTGYNGLALLAAFFGMATLATAHGKKRKAQLTPGGKHAEKRKPGQVLANGGVAAALGLLALFIPEERALFGLLAAAAISAATADTLASELGMIYGRGSFNILTFKREPRGLDGVISLEGTLIGIAGSAVIAAIYGIAHGLDVSIGIIILAGTIGNLADSVLGASLERKHYLNNDLVNTFNTLIAAGAAVLLYLML